ncbi:hypothetical protein UA08_04613 [Talaromyces atroroseus]|uniref:BZIP domain-containing protein n=1 Tax=Talaromyces atroroseus TaxID=1441469 RepID=A0A225AWI0_TALAT|nr:hypothetical protein UA08_04613 [Talaromyces atroroseus]OKL59969.1 hypothetical protein UA08_04613 [Talaromyces atroroseus]
MEIAQGTTRQEWDAQKAVAAVAGHNTTIPSRNPVVNLPSTIPSTESSLSGSLNFRSASRSSSSLSTFTLSSSDITSLTTDNQQQTWLPYPPPQQPSAQHQNLILNNNSNNNSNSNVQQDFVLYPQHQVSRPPASSWAEPSPAPLSVNLNQRSVQNQSLVNRRHTLQYSSVNVHQQHSKSVQPVNRLFPQSTGSLFPSSSYRYSPSGQKRLAQRLYAASLPANSPLANRPPVPLFNSTQNTPNYQKHQTRQQLQQHRRVMSSSNIAQGDYSHRPYPASTWFESISVTDANALYLPFSDFPLDLFDLSSQSPLLDDLTSPVSSMMASPLADEFAYMNTTSAAVPPGTVSPKDLISGPPSSFSTELGTPQSAFDSPGDLSFSHFTSPVYVADNDLPADHNDWTSLFPDSQVMPGDDFDMSMTSFSQKPTKPVPSAVCMSAESPASSEDTSSPKPSLTSDAPSHKSKSKRDLRDLKYDPADPVAVKRARNTMAARKSRRRKLEKQEQMEERIKELEAMLAKSEKDAQYWKAMAQAS